MFLKTTYASKRNDLPADLDIAELIKTASNELHETPNAKSPRIYT